MDFNTLCTNGKRNKYSTLQFTYSVVRHRLWRHNSITLHVMNVYCVLIIGLMLSFKDKIFIKNLWECKRFSARRLLREFPNKNWKRWSLDDFLQRLHTTGSIECKAGSGRPRRLAPQLFVNVANFVIPWYSIFFLFLLVHKVLKSINKCRKYGAK